jgi:glycosyltransferase involved in cell wall biosynthesis
MTPRVTVLMSVYNGERYLREAINSILNQTFDDFEFIIVDDGSTDNSPQIISAYDDERIRLIRNERNMGLTASLNKGLDLARGEYVARMDCDDVSLPERLAKQVAFMDANSGVGASSTDALDIDAEGNVLRRRTTLTGAGLENFYWRTPLIHPSAIIRFSQFKDLRYDERIRYAQDYDLWLRIKERSNLANLAECLLLYRVHDESITGAQAVEQTLSAYDIFCRHVGGRIISPDEFQAARGFSLQLNPLQRSRVTMKVTKAIRRPYRAFILDDLKYTISWLRMRKIYQVISRTRLFDALRRVHRKVRPAPGEVTHSKLRSQKTI